MLGPGGSLHRRLFPLLVFVLGEVRRERTGVEDTGHAQRLDEGPALDCLFQARQVMVKVRTPPRPPTVRIRDETLTRVIGNHDDSKQHGGWCAAPATHTGAHRGRATYH